MAAGHFGAWHIGGVAACSGRCDPGAKDNSSASVPWQTLQPNIGRPCRYLQDGQPVHSFDELTKIMIELGFELREEQDMPFVIREHARKFQWGCAHASAWVKVA